MKRKRKKERRLLHAFARLILNDEKLEPSAWGVAGLTLLTKLRSLDRKAYEKRVHRHGR